MPGSMSKVNMKTIDALSVLITLEITRILGAMSQQLKEETNICIFV